LLSADPGAMLDFVLGNNPLRAECPVPPPSERKLRLFAVACARQSWHLLKDGRSRRAVEVAELYADGAAESGTLREADGQALAALAALPRPPSGEGEAAFNAAADAMMCPRADILTALVDSVLVPPRVPTAAALLREIVGNPFRPASLPGGPEGVCPECRGSGVYESIILRPGSAYPCGFCDGSGTDGEPGPCPWLTPTAVHIARAIYADRDFAALTVLADVIEEAGCKAEDMLMHLRGKDPCPACLGSRFVTETVHVPDPPYMRRMIPHFEDRDTTCLRCGVTGWVDAGPHVRGCWALNLILGKE
jgi:hypothetical protein